MTETLYAYLAGALDADGSFMIKRSTYHMRVRGDAHNPVYSERIALRQVTAVVPELLRDTFGGSVRYEERKANSKPLYGWDTNDTSAANACTLLLPHLRIKRRQCELLLELRESKATSAYEQYSYWYAKEHPDWMGERLLTTAEATERLGYTHDKSIAQAIAKGTLLATAGVPGKYVPRVPLGLIEQIVSNRHGGIVRASLPPQLIEWRERLYQEVRALNRIGTGAHPISMRTGPYAQMEVA